ncbi:MAG: dihydrolipoyl dehydrogenase [Elusimicrobia bacterium]|nr:dihydrolipoyl dehydrogenase [Elusimicrobiota bacterium]
MPIETQVLIIGAGPGGYVAGIKLGQLGKKALLVDRDALGGECLNYGCIPSKAMISAAGIVHKARKAREIGVEAPELRVDMAKVQAWRANVIRGLNRGIGALSKANGVEVRMGEARLTGQGSAEVKGADGAVETIRFEHAILAAGSRAVEVPGLPFDGRNVLSNKEALELPEVPQRLLVVGGGVIGLEIGTYLAKLGTKVTVAEMLPQLLTGVDPELAQPVARSLTKLGVEVLLDSKAASFEEMLDGLEVVLATPQGERRIVVDKILVSVGRKPNSRDLGLEAAGVKADARGFVAVDPRYRTSVPRIHAVGDLIGPPFLAHKASREGVLAALAIAGEEPAPIGHVPSAIFTDPEIAFVGLTEAQAREQGLEPVVGRFPFAASGRAQTTREGEGFVKVVADKKTGRLLGAAIVGPSASDLIAEACLALRLEANLEDVASTIHPHPTLPEAFQEACEAALGTPIHLAPASKSVSSY